MFDLTITTDMPAAVDLGASDIADSFQREVGGAAKQALSDFMSDVVGVTPYPTIAGGYQVRDQPSTGGITVFMVNTVDYWIFREVNTRPHWPPWGPGTSLDRWAQAKGIPTFLVARKISRYGTQGNYIVRDTWAREVDDITAKIEDATYQWVTDQLAAAGII